MAKHKIKITKQQLVELKEKINLPPLVKKALVGEPIDTPTEAQQGILIYETPDAVKRSDDYLLAHWSSDDAIAFGFEHGKAYIGYNNELFFDSDKISEGVKKYVDAMGYYSVENMTMHGGISKFYSVLYEDNKFSGINRSDLGFPGRLWVNKKIISFWQYPDKEKLSRLIKMLWNEINNIYGIDIDFSDFKIEIKQNEYAADLSDDDEDYIPDVDWQVSKKIGSLIPIKDFISSSDATEQEMQAIHLLPSDEKRNTPQMQAARDADIERLSDKFNGNVSQAEWNAAKKKYQGESKIDTNGKQKLNEDADEVFMGLGKDSLFYSDYDAVAFGIDDNKMYVGYNKSLWLVMYDDLYLPPTHSCIEDFYKHLVNYKLTNNDITYVDNTDNFTFPGRLWTISKVVSFWTTPPPNRIGSVLSMLKQELKTVYDYNLNIDVLKIEINGKLIPIQEYTGQNNTPEKIDPKIHLLPSDEKRNTPQMQAARDADIERLGDKFNGNVSQAEWNGAKKKYQGESKKIKITSNQLNEIKKYLLKENTLYHASQKPINNISPYSNYKNEKSGYYEGMFFYDDFSQYQNYFNQQKYTKNKYYFYEISADNLTLYNLTDSDKLKDEARKGGFPANNGSGYYESRYLDSIGYDGIKNRTEIILFHPERFDFKLISSPEIQEEITIPVTTGDTVMMGKFKNKKTVVKTIDKDKHGMPTINGKQATTFRTIKEELKNDLILYHGTKHNFLKFETSNIGGGEGNQSFGWGIYFTDNKSVSEFYANLLGGDNGLVYTINVSNGNFMSWYGKLESDFCDKLTSNMLQNGITELPINRMLNNGKIEINKLPTKEAIEYYPNGKFLYENLALALGGDKMASKKLNELGVDGVYYPIGQFLKKGDKSHANGTNYVLFSEDKIKIVNQDKINKNTVNESIDGYNNELSNTKIVDDNGNPLKVYRAQKNNRTQGVDRSSNHKGIYFSADKNSVKIYGDNINEYFLNIKNPIILKDLEWNLSVMPEYLYNNLIEKGYDGAIWIRKGVMYEIVAFYENQVIPINNNLTEATESDVNLSSFKPKNELNEKFWINNKLKSVVRKRLLKIADDFIEFLKVDIKKIDDILFLGSLANYNWSSYSDVDLHLLVDFKTINKDIELVREYFESKKKLWNDEHDNLKIFGFPIELYVQDKNDENASVGVFSLEKNKWLKKPEIIDDKDFDKKKIKEKAAVIMTDIDDLLAKYKKKPSFNELNTISNKVKKLYDKIKKMRKVGLASEKGETSVGNIVFKVLRRNGYMEKLVDLKTLTYDKINSIK